MKPIAVLIVCPLLAMPGSAGTPFIRGDSNGDGSVDISDAVRILLHLFGGLEATVPLDALDADDDGAISIADAAAIPLFLFEDGPPPGAPYPEAGFDITWDPFLEGDRYLEGVVGPPLPDLVPTALAFDSGNRILVTIANEGVLPVPTGKGDLAVFVDERLAWRYRLAELPDPSFLTGGSAVVTTGVRLAGSLRRIAVFMDSGGEVEELDEFHNAFSRTLTPPSRSGPDLAVGDLAVDTSGDLEVVVRNLGDAEAPAGLDVLVTVTMPPDPPVAFTAVLPAIAAGGGASTIYPDPPIPVETGRRVLVKVDVDPFSDLDTTNDSREEVLPEGPSLDAYRPLLDDPRIAGAIIWTARGDGTRTYPEWSATRKADLDRVLRSVELGEPMSLTGPPARIGDSCSAADAWEMYLAHVARSLWVEARGIVSWRLADLSDEGLALLLDGRKLFYWNDVSNTYRFESLVNVTDWNPHISFFFLSNLGLLRPTPLETIGAVTDWMRAHLIHISSGETFQGLYDYPGLPPVDKMLFPLEGKRHKTGGCWYTSSLYVALLRTANIPALNATILLGTGTHSRPEFPSVDRTMTHGDDPYNTYMTPSGAAIPASALLYPRTEFAARFLAPAVDCNPTWCNTPGEQAQYNKGRDHARICFDGMGDHLLYEYAQYGPAYVDDSLRGPRIGGGVVEYAKPYFEPEERASMIAELEAALRAIGGGDLESGKAKVRARYGRFGGHK
jgi:hypothetical protein